MISDLNDKNFTDAVSCDKCEDWYCPDWYCPMCVGFKSRGNLGHWDQIMTSFVCPHRMEAISAASKSVFSA